MKSPLRASALAIAIAACWPVAVSAQTNGAPPVELELAAMRAEMERMAARIDVLESELEQAEAKADNANVKAAAAVETANAATQKAEQAKGTAIAFKGAPEIKGEGGWSFKPRGRLQYDAGFTAVPSTTGRADGFGNEARRLRLGVGGDIPGGFGYKFEVDFAGNSVAVTDAIISYGDGKTELSVGQMNNFQSLEELTSSLHTTFIERAAFTDAFGFERRVGAAAQVKAGSVLVQAGLFSDNLEELSNRNWGGDARVVVNPQLADATVHLGASVHYTALESGASVRYRQRPLVHFTSDRFIDTRALGADSELGIGIEGALVSGPFHVAAEGFWQTVSIPAGMEDPTFFGGYAEIGYFLTAGDTRGYKDGKFDRVKPSRAVGKGGAGSVQVNLRYDYLDLNDASVIGGKQNGYLLSLAWKPTDYTLLLANYGRLEYDDAAIAALAGDRSYSVDSFGLRAQIDF